MGVIDEGIQYTHPDLDGQVWTNPNDLVDGKDNDGNGYVDDVRGWDFANNDNTIYDGGTKGNLDDHGTHVAGTIGAKADGAGVVGVNWNVTLISGKFLGARGGITVTGGRLNVSGFVTTATPSEPTKPSAPTNLSATGGDSTVDLAWSAPLSDGGSAITGYKVYRDGLYLATTSATSPSYPDTAVTNGSTYTYHVTALNTLGESVASNTASATPSEAPARSVTVTPGVKKKSVTPVTVTWAGFGGTDVDITRSGSTFSNPNSGSLTENWRGSGTVTYTICETGSSTACASASATI